MDRKMNRELTRLPIIAAAAMTTMLLGIATVHADDTEIFTAYTTTSPNSNVIFMLDTSGSMGNPPQNAVDTTNKIQIVKNVFERLIYDASDPTVLDPNNNNYHKTINPKTKGLNFALMRFDDRSSAQNRGGYFITGLNKLNNGSMDSFWTAVNGLQASGSTPLAETAYEAALFFKGDAPYFGNSTSPGTNVAGITLGNGNYKTPFAAVTQQTQCSINNHLVILTDGMPTSDGDADALINGLPNTSTCSFASNNDCLPQVAKYLHDTDFVDNVAGVQNVKTHTIAFDLQATGTQEFLRSVAEDFGGGMSASAQNADQLAEAISNIIKEVVDTATSFVSPAVSISSSNRFVHDNTVYFGMFKPEVSPKWTGNMKGYQVSETGELMDFSNPPINALADTGEISPLAKSKWSSSVDGNNIGAGGAASKIGLVRNIYTQNNNNGVVVFNGTNVSQADLGAANATETTSIINWAKGRTDDGSALRAKPLGDPLHSTPQVVNYGGSIGSVIYYGTNEGFLHAVDAETGVEKFAFIPRALLGNLKTFKDNTTGADRPYGLDGPITVYVKDANGDGQITDNGEDTVLVIVGMRRGGNNYYALNVTDVTSPSLQWQITGGSGDFAAMGQTWAKPVVTKLNIGSFNSPDKEEVVLLSGGYDEQYDDLGATPSNQKGNAIYAVGLRTGERLWYASSGSSTPTADHLSLTGLVDAIPSDVSAIDINSDGVVDRLYATDIKGRIFRIDFNNTVTDAGGNTSYLPSGQLFADLQSGSRRFYYGVDIAYTYAGFKPVLHLSVGSGHRAHPLADNSQDRFYDVWDEYVKVPLPDGFTALTTSSLVDVTSLPVETAIEHGWYFDMHAGEKVLSQASSMAGYVFFTTYTPPQQPETPTCIPPLGSGKLYAVKLYNSEALSNDRAIALNTTGIPPSPTFMALDQNTDGSPGTGNEYTFASQDTRRVVLVGGENPLSDDDEDKLNSQSDTSKTYWQIIN